MHRSRFVPHRHRIQLLGLTVIAALIVSAVPATAASPGKAGFKTKQAAMLTPVGAGVTVTPLITVGDKVGGYTFESVPDGIALKTRGKGRVDVYVNHETSRVPFQYTPAAPTESNSQNDFDNAQVSLLRFNRKSGGILSGKMVITSDDDYQRFCSSYLATAKEGFDRELLFANEESVDWVNRSGNAWPAVIGADDARQSGVVVAYDVRTGQDRPIWGMGRHNHENSVPIPGFGKVVMLSGDDTFTNSPSQSQLYSYIAPDADAVWNDEGALWAFKSNDAAKQRYEDFAPGDATSVSGQFVEVPRLIATGRNADGTDLMAADVPAAYGGPYAPPPSDGTWQRDANGVGIDGPQWVLERWSQLNGVFRFVRVEDIAYDKRPGMSNVAYVVDSGRGTAGASQAGRSTNGRVWRLAFDPTDPTKVTAMSILIEGDDMPVKTVTEIHQPDNIETTVNGLYLTEDPGSSQQFQAGSTDAAATTARLWQYRFSTGLATVVLKVNQSADEGPTDVDASTTPGAWGAWESSGIVDASAAFGPGAFLVDVQAGTLWVEKAPGDDNVAPAGADFTDKRAGGQLLLVRIPNP
jgi:serralysin